ncbi:MAG: helix-turn-helix transcriptional regulator [Eubacteriales bacterium]|nr:helix-turn-helix transcriptional regulator [Eubacteriales bacterium]
MFSFKPLWKLLIDKGLNKAELTRRLGISPSTMNRMSHDQYVAMEILDKICTELNCTPNDIIEHIPE